MPNITANHAITYTNTTKQPKNVVWTLYIKIAMSCNLLYKVGNFALCNFVYLSQGVVLSVMRQFLCFLKVLSFFFARTKLRITVIGLVTLLAVERFSNYCRKTKTKAITPTNHNRCRQRDDPSQFLAILCNSLQAREKSRVHGAIGFGFASHWLKNWRESFKSITKRSNRDHVITFDSHLKTALTGASTLKNNNDNKKLEQNLLNLKNTR